MAVLNLLISTPRVWYEYDMYIFGVRYVMMEEVYMVVLTASMMTRPQHYIYGSFIAGIWVAHRHIWVWLVGWTLESNTMWLAGRSWCVADGVGYDMFTMIWYDMFVTPSMIGYFMLSYDLYEICYDMNPLKDMCYKKFWNIIYCT